MASKVSTQIPKDCLTMPYIEKGKLDGPPIVFMAGFPDNQLSGWGTLMPTALGKTHRLIFMCLPDYEDSARTAKPWGHTFEEILTIMHTTLNSLGLTSQPVMFIAHDWGSFFTQLYLTRYPDAASKLVLCDVGRKKVFFTRTEQFKMFFYQLYFAFAYVISQALGSTAGSIVLRMFVDTGLFKLVGPVPHDPIPEDIVTVQKCYPYYHFWKTILTGGKLPPLRLPSCPILFLYGTRKAVFFHDDKFLEKLDATDGCRYKAIDGGHWFMIQQPEETMKEILQFFNDN